MSVDVLRLNCDGRSKLYRKRGLHQRCVHLDNLTISSQPATLPTTDPTRPRREEKKGNIINYLCQSMRLCSAPDCDMMTRPSPPTSLHNLHRLAISCTLRTLIIRKSETVSSRHMPSRRITTTPLVKPCAKEAGSDWRGPHGGN